MSVYANNSKCPPDPRVTTEVVYSFSGQWMYFELIDTMAEPKELLGRCGPRMRSF